MTIASPKWGYRQAASVSYVEIVSYPHRRDSTAEHLAWAGGILGGGLVGHGSRCGLSFLTMPRPSDCHPRLRGPGHVLVPSGRRR